MAIANYSNKDKEVKLSIQVSLNGLSFCAINSSGRKIEFLKELRFSKKLSPVETLQQIEKIYQQEDYLKNRPKKVELLFSNELYSLVPEKFFREKDISDYLKFNTKILETDFVAHDHIPEFGLMNVYIPFTNINNYFFDKYGEFEYRHDTSILIEEFLKLEADKPNSTKVYLNRNFFGYDLIVIKNGKLLLNNSFQCDTKEDFIYYLLFTAEQLELDTNTLELILLGNITQNSDYYEMAYTYIRNISFLKTSFGFIFDAENVPPKGYKYFTLLKSLE